MRLRALTVFPALLLTGCGVAGTQFHPGIAAEVGDRTITTKHLDQVADDYCKAVEKVSKDQPAAGGTQTPMRYLTHEFAIDLIVQAAAEQFADEQGVTPTETYKQDLAQLEPQLSKLNDAEKDAVREVIGSRSYARNVLSQIGLASLEEQGNDEPTADEQYTEGQKLLAAWVADHDVEINPKYAIDFGTAEQVDTDLSVAVGSKAKDGLLAKPDAEYTSSLPDNLVCLD